MKKLTLALTVLTFFLSAGFLAQFSSSQTVSAMGGTPPECLQASPPPECIVGGPVINGGDEQPPTDEFETTGICEDDSYCDCDVEGNLDSENCQIIRYVEIGINVLSGLAGIAIVAGIMVGGYMYMTARDNPGQIAAARQRIVWALVALLILIFFWGVLQWLVPGGVLNGGGAPPPTGGGGPS